jgi:hypothetical protein
MHIETTRTDDEIAAVRAKLLEDLATIPVIAAAFDRSTRTIMRLNLPTVFVGRTPYIRISAAREALLATAQTRHQTPRRGRPRKAA